jgi:hypothetical protein
MGGRKLTGWCRIATLYTPLKTTSGAIYGIQHGHETIGRSTSSVLSWHDLSLLSDDVTL